MRVQRKEQSVSSKLCTDTCIFTSTLYHQLPMPRCSEASLTLLPRSCMHRCKWIELQTRDNRPYPSQLANSSCIVRTKWSLCVRRQCSRSARMSILLDYRNRYDIEQSPSPLALREAPCPVLHGPQGQGVKCLAFGMHLHDHLVCAHGPTVLTNPERSEW